MERTRRLKKPVYVELPLGDESELENESEDELQDPTYDPKSSKIKIPAGQDPEAEEESSLEDSEEEEEEIEVDIQPSTSRSTQSKKPVDWNVENFSRDPSSYKWQDQLQDDMSTYDLTPIEIFRKLRSLGQGAIDGNGHCRRHGVDSVQGVRPVWLSG